MKRIAVWAFYGVGAMAIAYLALYAYAVFTGRDLQPGDPIRIFRKPDAPSYSGLSTLFANQRVGVKRRPMTRNDGEGPLLNLPRQNADAHLRRPG
ncbi:hypothetical protein V1283_000123 [Bradyrhizobium sp. AZCC 2262]|uniref:hypothetical protein n=1 Tax=Bradyrhizobium sp. AZCC 2262 TaxID=3117022 RepID=UPI002FEF06D8